LSTHSRVWVQRRGTLSERGVKEWLDNFAKNDTMEETFILPPIRKVERGEGEGEIAISITSPRQSCVLLLFEAYSNAS
jgi:hypothetical protein